MRYHALPKEPVIMADEILTVAEVAVLLKVAEKTVYTMAQKSELPCFKVRGQWRFRRQDLDSWMASQVKGPVADEQPAPKPKTPRPKTGARR
jgi:excisionase family DNA binding protein